jgi:hypothetical protein
LASGRLRALLLPMLRVACLFACLAVPACADRASGWRTVPPGERTPGQDQQLASADAAKGSLLATLQQELTAAIRQHGTRGAIAICRVRAPELAAEVGSRLGVRLGRTAARLRNSDNAPPPWAASLLAADGNGPWTSAGPNGVLGAMFEIRLQPLCVQCHGQPEELASGVTEALRTLYPRDAATGHGVGDRRGFVWVEVPARL